MNTQQESIRQLSNVEMESLKGGFWHAFFHFFVHWIFEGVKVQAPGCTPEFHCFPPPARKPKS